MARLTRQQLESDRDALMVELGNALHRISILELEKADYEIELQRMHNQREVEHEFLGHVIQDLDPSEDRE